jgi:hypothetical protein
VTENEASNAGFSGCAEEDMMNLLRIMMRIAMIGLAVLALSSVSGNGQRPGPPQLPGALSGQDTLGQTPNNKAEKDQSPFGNSAEKQSRLREEERQRRLVSDSDKLLELATALHNEVAKTDKHILSVDVVKRADEIEKLARSVKDRMKG